MPEVEQKLTLDLLDYQGPAPDSKLQEFVMAARDSLRYAGLQAPLEGVSQLADHSLGTSWNPTVKFWMPPQPAEIGTPAWWGQTVGATVGAAWPFLLMHKLAGPGAAQRLEMTAHYGFGRQILRPLLVSSATGGLYSGVFVPVGDHEKNFWSARLRNTGVGAVTFPLLTAGAIGLKATGHPGLSKDYVAASVAGIPAGVVHADLHSLLTHGKFAGGKERYEAAATFFVGGLLLGAANSTHESIRPSSGVPGVRTLAEMRALAERTRVEDFQVREPVSRQHDAIAARLTEPHQRLLQKTSLTPSDRELVVASHKDLVSSLEALQGIDRRLVTIYGSARLDEGSFAYWRTQYLAGRLAQEGFGVMTGGARKGIMGAGNEAAFKAGGKSVGVGLELPLEDPFNPYHDLTLMHKEFFTRKEVLRRGDAFVVEEGGLGTLDEAFELLTHMQTGKMPKKPVYLIGSKYYAPVRQQLTLMYKAGTISKSDFGLFRMVDNPDLVVADLVRMYGRQPESLSGSPPRIPVPPTPGQEPVSQSGR